MDARRRRLLNAFGGALAAVPLKGRAAAPAPLPALAQIASDGEPVLAPAAGGRWRLLLIDFWASWCGPCRRSFPWMNAMHERHRAAGLRIVAVNVDTERSEADAFLQRFPARFALAFDPSGEMARAAQVQVMPTALLVARDRRVLLTHRGFVDDERERLEASILSLLDGPS
jgi:thiol-disulfide isomerase/thioredoxin